jgi:hypothetical protein
MFLIGDADVWDLDLDYLQKHLSLIDAHLDIVAKEARGCGDPDAFGVFDEIESLVGFGFAACQRYLTATYGWMKLTKGAALAAGPKHRSGLSIAEIVNHTANYWKHHEEWNGEKTSKQQQRTEAGMKLIGVLDSDYPVSNALGELTTGTAFKPLLSDLRQWRDQLRASLPCPPGTIDSSC